MTDLLHEVRDGIAYLTFNRPQARNALTFAMYDRLAEICAAANEDRAIRAMVLSGAGDKAFAAGTDISQFRAFDKAQDALDYEARIDRVLGALEACRVPTIAAIQGACTGGGAEKWTVTKDGALHSSGGECLAVVNGKAAMQACQAESAQQWRYTLKGNLVNNGNLECLTAAGPESKPQSLEMQVCGHNLATQIWSLPN